MCKELKFKPLTADQIEVKVTDTKVKGKATLLLYIDSRAAADILNDTVGVWNWEIKYKDVAGQIYGALSIYDDNRNIWVTKEDTGEESNIAEKKGQASDILKRCIARWGCDWLYRTPRIKVSGLKESYYWNDKLTEKFAVKSIAWDENTKECIDLVIVDSFGNEVYNYANCGTKLSNATKITQQPTEYKTIDNKDNLIEFCKKAKSDGADQEILKKYYNYYKDKVANWNGRFDAKSLFEKWCEREKK